jgi:Zn-dependent protease with chaperone function
MLRAFLAQSILHALVAALVVEALLRVWRIGDAAWRLRFRLLALIAPLAWLPTLFLIAPFRTAPVFVVRHALFAGERWNAIVVGGTGLGDLTLLLAAGLGSALFLRDALPSLRDLIRGGSTRPSPGPWEPAGAAIAAIAARHASALGIAPPEVRIVRAHGPVLLCEGGRRPSLVAASATVAQLAPDELDAAVAHEIAHAAFRDPAWGLVLFAVRGLLFFNPAAQWIARALVDDIERRADQSAVQLTGRADSLARAIVRLFQESYPLPGDSDASFERLFWRVRREGIERRCVRLRAANAWTRVEHGWLRLALAAAGVLGLVFFVV